MVRNVWEWIVGGGGLLAIFGLAWKSSKDTDDKVKRAYKRLDEYKEHVEQKILPNYVRGELCVEKTGNMKETLHRVELTINNMNVKIDELMKAR